MGTGFLSFIRAFGVRWFVAMSGPLSVPLALAGYFAPGELAKIGLFATALFCAVFSSYWVWKVEREARNAAERKIAEFETGTAVLAALNDVFNQTHQLSNSAVTTADEYEAWKANINALPNWIRQQLTGKLPAAEINVLITTPPGPLLGLGGRFGWDHTHLLNYLYYLEQRVSRSIEKYS